MNQPRKNTLNTYFRNQNQNWFSREFSIKDIKKYIDNNRPTLTKNLEQEIPFISEETLNDWVGFMNKIYINGVEVNCNVSKEEMDYIRKEPLSQIVTGIVKGIVKHNGKVPIEEVK